MKRSLLQAYKDQPLLTKLILFHFVLIAPLLIMGYIMYNSFVSSMEQKVGNDQEDLIQQLAINIDTYMEELNRLSLSPYQDASVMEYLKTPRNPEDVLSIDQLWRLRQFVKQLSLNGRVDIRGVALYGIQGAAYIDRPDVPDGQYNPEWKQEAWYQKVLEGSGRVWFIGDHTYVSNRGGTYQVFTLARELLDLDNGQTVGYITLDVDSSVLKGMLEQVSVDYDKDMYLLEKSGDIAFTRTDREPPPIVKGLQGAGNLHLSKEGKIVIYNTSKVTGWRIVEVVPVAFLLKDMNVVRNFILLAAGISLLISLLFSIWIAVRITKPISLLRNLMKRVEHGELNVSIPITSRDEIGQLGHTFNIMASRLKQLGYRLFEMEIREKNSQIAVLQSQINPHFLYNTLGAISMYADVQGNTEVVQMTNNLSRLLRYSVGGNDSNEVELRREVEHVSGYMSILQVRSDNRLRFETKIPEELAGCSVLRFMLQPIVENAVMHGIEKAEGVGVVELSAVQEDDILHITVTDTGVGMSKSRLHELRVSLQRETAPEGPGGYGLINVHRRIVLRYGKQYGLSIDSRAGEGTVVHIHLPLRKEEDGHV
ncbi:sensor histidine kinase [Paenibacillus hexagrammi]|uniref:histidine kinase n=1 Tax=Paenibacillus hexagrammi TaxID=2908839 RepID=A0ABY3SHU2_9BACL|nr:sensor histidine kinase [Paenibacillus sp. YPD9-1]UJF32517.1 sensor histidine kinase [Paenibacillus sp. YPD9-1]